MVRLRLPRGRSQNGRSESEQKALSSLMADLNGEKGERLVRALLAKLGCVCHHDVRLPGASGKNQTQIDHLVLLPHAIMVIETKHYAGRITGFPRDRHWRQRLGQEGDSRLIYSPVQQNIGHCEAVRAFTAQSRPDIATLNRVVFTGSATVCAGLQPLVRSLDDLRAELRRAAGPIPADILELWQRLMRQAA